MERWKRFSQAYSGFMEKQGFYITLIVCILVIVLSSVYTFRQRDALENPTLAPEEESESVAAQQDETLALVTSQSAGEPLTVPTEPPLRFAQPVQGEASLPFSAAVPVYFESSRCWRMHLAIDIGCEYGAVVSACADGTVTALETNAELGLCVRVKHEDGYESLYAGLAEAPYARVGDPVRKGQAIGHAGDGVLDESGAHLHWAVWKDGAAIDPLSLLIS